jgi:hypothetical protein
MLRPVLGQQRGLSLRQPLLLSTPASDMSLRRGEPTRRAINRTRAVHSITCRTRWSADADDQLYRERQPSFGLRCGTVQALFCLAGKLAERQY